MALLLGIDTGGTFTDAVIHDEDAPAPGGDYTEWPAAAAFERSKDPA